MLRLPLCKEIVGRVATEARREQQTERVTSSGRRRDVCVYVHFMYLVHLAVIGTIPCASAEAGGSKNAVFLCSLLRRYVVAATRTVVRSKHRVVTGFSGGRTGPSAGREMRVAKLHVLCINSKPSAATRLIICVTSACCTFKWNSNFGPN